MRETKWSENAEKKCKSKEQRGEGRRKQNGEERKKWLEENMRKEGETDPNRSLNLWTSEVCCYLNFKKILIYTFLLWSCILCISFLLCL